jgi:hypothetical protein
MLGDWWDYVPGAKAAYDYVAAKWAEFNAAGADLPVLDRTAAAIQAEAASLPDVQQQAGAIRHDVADLSGVWAYWQPRLASALNTIRNALGLGQVLILAMTVIVAAAAVVALFLSRRSGAERALLALQDSLPPDVRARVAERLAGNVSGKGALESLGGIVQWLVIGGVAYLGYAVLSKRRAA